LRLLLRPWRGPWTEELSPPQGVLELSLEDGPASRVLVRVWLDPDSAEPADVARIPSSQVGTAWGERLALDFVERLLARA
jgi:hypothetical protein